MQIDRSKFLLLTTTISAGVALVASVAGGAGCSSTAATADAGGTDGSTSVVDSGGETDSSTSDGSADGGDGGACLGDLGTPSCEALGDGGADGGADSGADCQLSCVQALTNLRPAVADQAGKCLLGLPTCEGGGPDVVACFDEAVAKACPAPDAPAFCARLESLCVDAGAPDAGAEASAKCGAIASALNATGRTTLESCVIESGCALSFDTCVAQLK